MQAIKIIKQKLCNNRGSALVGVVVVSILIGIAVTGVMSVTGSTVNHEAAALENEKAFYAAESGLLMGTRWLTMQANWPAPGNDQTIVNSLLINGGISVEVRDSIGTNDTVYILAKATSGKLSYTKNLSWVVLQVEQPSGQYGTYINDAFNWVGNSRGLRKLDDWIRGQFDGPFHSNTPIHFFNAGAPGNTLKFNDRVTVYNDPNYFQQDYGEGTRINGSDGVNKYHFGLFNNQGALTGTQCDNIFQGPYTSPSPKMAVNFNKQGEYNVNLSSGNKTLTFNGTTYSYINNAGVTVTRQIGGSAGDKIIHIVNSDVQVKGIVQGQTTLYTDTLKKITVTDNLTYSDFNSANFNSHLTDITSNFGYGTTSSNILGLYSGANIEINNNVQYVTAQLFADNANGTVLFPGAGPHQIFRILGSRTVASFWDPAQGNNQPYFDMHWDRRQLSAPGLGFIKVDGNGNPIISVSTFKWTEKNI